MFWTNFAGLLTAVACAFGAGHMFEGIAFCTRHPEVTAMKQSSISHARSHVSVM